MTKQVAFKVLSEFWCWYRDVEKTVSRITDDEHEQAALDEVGEHSFDELPLPSLDAKFYICGKEFEVRALDHQRGSHTGFIVFYTPFFSPPPLHKHRTKIWSVLVCKGGKWAEQSFYLILTWGRGDEQGRK